jgi:hypothetical protein
MGTTYVHRGFDFCGNEPTVCSTRCSDRRDATDDEAVVYQSVTNEDDEAGEDQPDEA